MPIINGAFTSATTLWSLGMAFVRDIFPQDIHLLSSIPAQTNLVDLLTLCTTTAAAFCLMAALVPAWFAARVDPAVALRDSG